MTSYIFVGEHRGHLRSVQFFVSARASAVDIAECLLSQAPLKRIVWGTEADGPDLLEMSPVLIGKLNLEIQAVYDKVENFSKYFLLTQPSWIIDRALSMLHGRSPAYLCRAAFEQLHSSYGLQFADLNSVCVTSKYFLQNLAEGCFNKAVDEIQCSDETSRQIKADMISKGVPDYVTGIPSLEQIDRFRNLLKARGL